jgi:hypothetical protein
MKSTLTLGAFGVLAAGAALVAVPKTAHAQDWFDIFGEPPPYYAPGYGVGYEPDLVTGSIAPRRRVRSNYYYAVRRRLGRSYYYYAPLPGSEYARPELRRAPSGRIVRTRLIQRNPDLRVPVDQYGRVVGPNY